MLHVKNSTHYTGSKVWATVEDAGNILASVSAAKTKLQSVNTAKFEDTAKGIFNKQKMRKEFPRHDNTAEGPKCALEKCKKSAVSKDQDGHENKDCAKKALSEISNRTTRKKKLKKFAHVSL